MTSRMSGSSASVARFPARSAEHAPTGHQPAFPARAGVDMPDAQLGTPPGRWQGWRWFCRACRLPSTSRLPMTTRDLIPAHLQKTLSSLARLAKTFSTRQTPFGDPLLIQVDIGAQEQGQADHDDGQAFLVDQHAAVLGLGLMAVAALAGIGASLAASTGRSLDDTGRDPAVWPGRATGLCWRMAWSRLWLRALPVRR